MTVDSWIQLSIAVPVFCGFIWVIGLWMGKRAKKSLNQILLQVTPNGGDSMTIGDRIVRLEKNQIALSESQRLQTESLKRIEGAVGKVPKRNELPQ